MYTTPTNNKLKLFKIFGAIKKRKFFLKYVTPRKKENSKKKKGDALMVNGRVNKTVEEENL